MRKLTARSIRPISCSSFSRKCINVGISGKHLSRCRISAIQGTLKSEIASTSAAHNFTRPFGPSSRNKISSSSLLLSLLPTSFNKQYSLSRSVLSSSNPMAPIPPNSFLICPKFYPAVKRVSSRSSSLSLSLSLSLSPAQLPDLPKSRLRGLTHVTWYLIEPRLFSDEVIMPPPHTHTHTHTRSTGMAFQKFLSLCCAL